MDTEDKEPKSPGVTQQVFVMKIGSLVLERNVTRDSLPCLPKYTPQELLTKRQIIQCSTYT